MRLFNIGEEYNALYELLEDIETDENGVIVDNSETIAELFNGLEVEFHDKLTNSTYLIKELEANAKTLKEEAKRLTEKAKTFENRGKRIKALIKDAILQSGEMKHKTDKFSFNVRTSEVYNYDNVNLEFTDDEFIKVKKELDKTQIKQFIKAGGTVEGVKISEDTVLTVR